VATPETIEVLLNQVLKQISASNLAVHLHDTYGQAIANIRQSLTMGISIIDSSVAGLGGCPYAKGASGNVATEKVVHLLDQLGIEHHVDLEKLNAVGRFIRQKLNRPTMADNDSTPSAK
jgi:hydroxymethylglutaryl-CoA lyase